MLMIENAKLSNDTRSSLIFKLTTELILRMSDPIVGVHVLTINAMRSFWSPENHNTNEKLCLLLKQDSLMENSKLRGDPVTSTFDNNRESLIL